MFERNIATQYFGFRSPAGHALACPLRGTDTWDVTAHRHEPYGRDTTVTTIRLLCRTCGTVLFERFEGGLSFEYSSTKETGYGSRPSKVAGLWLHAGPTFWSRDDRGPTAFYVTRDKDIPLAETDVLGVVGWSLTRRGAVRWWAGLGCRPHGGVETSAGIEFASRTAAVRWLADQISAVA